MNMYMRVVAVVVIASLLLGCWYLLSAPGPSFQEAIHNRKESGEAQDLAATHPPLLRSSLAPGPVYETIDYRKESVEAQDLTEHATPCSGSTVDLNDSQKTLKMDLVIVPYFTAIGNVSEEVLSEREKEYVTVLQRNLRHDLVRCIHVLTTNAEEIWQHLKKFDLPKNNKLLISEVKSIEMMRDVFEYISRNLVGRDVMFVNADIWLGNGFDRIDPQVMHRQRIMYTLTRQVTEEEMCAPNNGNFCMNHYTGSHDSFLFHVTEALPESALKHLNYRISSLGIENVLIWVFQKQLKYCTLNPCTILETFHFHCSRIHNHEHWPRVNNARNTGLSPFTKSLVCLPSRG